MKKTLFFLFALWLNSMAFAWDIEHDGLRYNIIATTDNTHKDVQVSEAASPVSGKLVIPSSFIMGKVQYNVTSIGGYAFDDCDGLTSVTISEGVTSIEKYAFENCYRLTSVTIPSSVTSIGEYAFHDSGLTSVTIPSSVTSIGEHAFYECDGLTSVTISEGVESIGKWAFENCYRLTSVTIPSSVTSIGQSAFYGCDGLTSVTISEGVTSIGGYAFNGCSDLTSVTIPSSVTSIGKYAFSRSGLTSVTISEGVTSIGEYAFYGCSDLTSVTIPSSVTSIEQYAFYECSDLTSVNIPEGVTSIGQYTFYGCSDLTSVNIPEGVTSIGGYAFRDCYRLTSVTIPSSVTSIGQSAFYNCSLTAVYSKMKIPCACTFTGSPVFYIPLGSTDKYIKQGWNSKSLVEVDLYHTLELSNTQVTQGANVWMPVSMETEESITAFQFEVSLPVGVTMTGCELSERKADHTISFSKKPNGNYQVTCFSLSSKAFSGTEGLLVNLQLATDKVVEIGNYEVSLKNIELTTTTAKVLTVAAIIATLTVCDVKPIKIGDTNDDGRISITDAVTIVNFILGRTPANYVAEASDVNGDGRTSITDAVAIVNKILSGETEAKDRIERKADLLDPQ